jgi:hypothetical protein
VKNCDAVARGEADGVCAGESGGVGKRENEALGIGDAVLRGSAGQSWVLIAKTPYDAVAKVEKQSGPMLAYEFEGGESEK